MPSVTDLRASLRDRERYAGDSDAVLTTLRAAGAQRRRPRRGSLAPLIAAGLVLAVAAGVTVYAGNRREHLPVQHADAGFLHFTIRFAKVTGFTLEYGGLGANQVVTARRSHRTATTAIITMFPKNAFDPSTASDDSAPLRGTSVTIDGRHAISTPQNTSGQAVLYWQYAPNAWGQVVALGTSTSLPYALAKRLAEAIHPGRGPSVYVPFRVRDLPAGLSTATAEGFIPHVTTSRKDVTHLQPTVTFQASDADRYDAVQQTPTVLAISRVRAKDAPKPTPPDRNPASQNSIVLTRDLHDGTVLTATVPVAEGGLITRARERRILDATDVSPDFGATSSWLAVPLYAKQRYTAPSSPTPPPGPLQWQASISAGAGYSLVRQSADLQGQTYEVVGGGRKYYLEVFRPGVFDPKHVGDPAAPLYGRRVTIDGRPGYFQAWNTNTLYWQYAPGAWASQFGNSLQSEVKVAQALTFDRPSQVTLPFRIRRADLPARWLIASVNVVGTYSVAYSPDGQLNPFDGNTFTVTRGDASDIPSIKTVRTIERKLRDGTVLAVAVPYFEWKNISAAQQRKILDDTDVSPKPDDPSTWLPIQ